MTYTAVFSQVTIRLRTVPGSVSARTIDSKCPRATANRRGRDQRTGWRPLI